MKYYDKNDKWFNRIVTGILIVFCIVMIYPLIYVLANSFSSPLDVYRGDVLLWPKNFSLAAYRAVFSSPDILRGYRNTIVYTLVGTFISLTITIAAAYPLSRKDLRFKKAFTLFFVITMFVSGGMIPTYLVVDRLGLINTMFGFILPGALSVWNIMICRTYMRRSIPWEIQEAAMLDGFSDFRILWNIILPLAKPMIAIMVLFYAVGYWNSYFNALIYLNDRELYPLQMILTEILITHDVSGIPGGGYQPGLGDQAPLIEALKFATIVVSSIPMIVLYPFIQKYFVKGMMVGSLKD